MLEVDDLINYSTKRGSAIYDKGIQALDDKALTDGFSMTQAQTVVFVEALQNKCTQMGWNQGTKQITSFINRKGRTVDIIKNYGQIDEVMLKQQCERFCKPGKADAQSRAKQNNTMMCACLSKTLTADAKAKLLAHRSDFTFDAAEIKSWKKVPPKSGDSKEKKQGDYTYHWCEHHMAWTVHKPADCRLGKKHKEEQKPSIRANSTTVVAAATTAVNPHYVALLATLSELEDDK